MKSSMLPGCLVACAIAVGTADVHAADKPMERSKERPATLVATDERVNINTATEAELSKLKGVGLGLARKIIEHRNAQGAFKRPEDIRKVQGMGKGLWEQNRDRITVR